MMTVAPLLRALYTYLVMKGDGIAWQSFLPVQDPPVIQVLFIQFIESKQVASQRSIESNGDEFIFITMTVQHVPTEWNRVQQTEERIRIQGLFLCAVLSSG